MKCSCSGFPPQDSWRIALMQGGFEIPVKRSVTYNKGSRPTFPRGLTVQELPTDAVLQISLRVDYSGHISRSFSVARSSRHVDSKTIGTLPSLLSGS